LKEKLKTGKMQELDSYLILPIQRIPRYVLLLQELVKHTWKDHADYQKLCEAWGKMQKTANYMNEKKKETENSFKVLEIKSKIDGNFEKELALPHRKFVIQIDGYTPDKKKLPRVLFMFNDIMLITEPKNGESYKLLGSPILIEKVRGVDVPNSNNYKFLTSMDEVALEIVMYTAEQKKLLEEEFTKQRSELDNQKKIMDEKQTQKAKIRAAHAKELVEKRYQSIGASATEISASGAAIHTPKTKWALKERKVEPENMKELRKLQMQIEGKLEFTLAEPHRKLIKKVDYQAPGKKKDDFICM